MIIVSNSSPLIYLAKIGKIHLLRDFCSHILIPPNVKEEIIDRGMEERAADAYILNALHKKGFLKASRTKIKPMPNTIHEGEQEAISLALDKKAGVILLDDAEAITIAETYGLKVWRTTRVLLELLKAKKLDFEEVKKLLIELKEHGYYITTDSYYLITAAAERMH